MTTTKPTEPAQLLQCVISTLTEWARGERADANEAHDHGDRDTAQQHRNRAENFDHQARQLLPALEQLNARPISPILVRVFVEGGVVQGVSSDRPGELDVFIWDVDENDGDRPSLTQDAAWLLSPEETRQTRKEAEFQEWQEMNSEDPIDHKGAAERIRGRGDYPSEFTKTLPETNVFQANADLYTSPEGEK